MNILEILRRKESFEVIHHVALIQAPLNVVGAQLAEWFTGNWREASVLTIKPLVSGPLQVGSKYEGHYKFFSPVRWKYEVTEFTPNALLSSALSGFFKGKETLVVEERSDVIKVDYTLQYEIQNPFNQIIWSTLLEDKFVPQIPKPLDLMKAYCEKVK